MQNPELLRLQLNHLVTQARYDIYTLSTLQDSSMKSQILQRLWDTISSINFLSEMLLNQTTTPLYTSPIQEVEPTYLGNAAISPITPTPPLQPAPQNQRTFTLEELSKFDGKNGRPAYVAVNGVVYDVTNNRAWAAATHFSLTAGKDYTNEFASCHAGQGSILMTLPVVGRLV